MRRIAALLVAVAGIWIEVHILSGRLVSRLPGGPLIIGGATALVLVVAIAALLFPARERGARTGAVRLALTLPAFVLITMFIAATIALEYRKREQHLPPTFDRDAALAAELRQVIAAQEQYRLVHQTYATSADSLHAWTTLAAGSSLALRVHGDSGWSGRLARAGGTCSVWVRDSTLRTNAAEMEGAPNCGPDQHREVNQVVRSVLADTRATHVFSTAEATGEWDQHRHDDRRSATASPVSNDARAYNWTTRIGGELRAPVAIVGNQVFVGAHGNGEFAALSLQDGSIGYRVRAPNWIHHEPVVTPDLAIVGFGNNERSGSDSISGSAPGGIVAFDRRTGREHWQRITTGAVMTSPVVVDSVVAVVTGAGEAIGWRVSDGAERWHRTIPSYSAMGNPLLADSLMIFGVEPRTICALIVRTGRLQYCRTLRGLGSGAGHTSVARAGDLALLVFDDGESAANENLSAPLSVMGLLKLIDTWLSLSLFNPESKELVMVGVNIATGNEVWRTRLGAGFENVKGHIAGTPVVAGAVAYLPSPVNGDIVAIRADSGRVLWKTNVRTARGSVLFIDDAVVAATTDSNVVVLAARDGHERCRQKLPGRSDRAGLTLSGSTAVLTLQNGLVMARPIADWLNCRA